MSMSATTPRAGVPYPSETATLRSRVTEADGKAVRYEADTLSDDDWDAMAAGFEDVTYEQTAAYCTNRWDANRNSHMVVRRNGTIIAAARVLQFTIPGLEKGLAYVKFGPMWRRRDGYSDPDAYHAALAALVEEYCNRRGHLLSILPRPNPVFGSTEQALLEECGFRNRRPFEDRNRYLVDLSLDEDEQRKSLSQTWRRNLKKAESCGLKVALGTDNDMIAQFQALHAHMVDRKNAAHGDALDMLPLLLRELPPILQPKFVIASHEGAPVAGAVIALNGDTAYYIYGATNSQALPLRAGYALQWWIVRYLSRQAVHWYDLGGTAGNAGLSQFKSGLVGSQGRIVVMPGEFDRWKRPGDKLAADTLYSLRRLAKLLASKLPGNLSE